jgi:asparagine synthase (glutamine-hydrolysing)
MGQVSTGALGAAQAALLHRGPDGAGIWVSNTRQVALGHVRLSIIDPEHGAQPISNEAGTVHAIVNGEFYGFEELRRQLIALGHVFRSKSDSEILVHLYEEYGTSCLSRLRGEFSFVLWDDEQKCLFAARDRFGIKPLYYAYSAGALLLGSEVKALLAAGVPARWDAESLYQDLHFHLGEDRTLFAGIRQVPPGHFLRVNDAHDTVGKYWDLLADSPPRPDLACLSEPELVRQFAEALEAATHTRMRADVPVGCYLSGGIDSSVLISLASAASSRPLDAFTVTFADDASDEFEHAAEMARHVGARLHRLDVDEDLLAEHYADAVWHCELIHYNTNFVAKYLLSRRVRDSGIKVVLTGAGADEILLGYPTLVRDAGAVVGTPADCANPAERRVRSILGFVPAWMSDVSARGSRISKLLSDDFAARFARRDPTAAFLDRLALGPDFARQEPALKSTYLFCRSILCTKLLAYLGDRMEMAHSVEARLPFLDHELASLAFRLPTAVKLRDGVEKYVLRKAGEPHVTERIRARRKNPFVAPHGLRGRMLQLIGDRLHSRNFSALGVFDPRAARALFDRVLSATSGAQRDVDVRDLLLLTSTAVLQERFGLA